MHRWHPLSRVPVCAVLCLLALAGAGVGETQTWIDSHKPLTSTAMILVPLDAKSGSQGTGFVVDRKARLMVTNNHVVQNKGNVQAILPVFDGFRARVDRDFYLHKAPRLNGKVLFHDPKCDLALLELESMPAGFPELPLSKDGPKVGERVHTSGNPGDESRAFVYTGGKVTEVGTAREFLKPDNLKQLGVQADCRLLQIKTESGRWFHGVSGSPVINDSAQVVGVIFAGPDAGGPTSMCIDVKMLRGFLGDAHRNLGSGAIRQKEYDKAVTYCTRALEFNPQDPLTLNERGVAYSYQDRYDQAIADYTAALKLNPKLQRTYRSRGSAYFHLGEYEKTVKDCTEALALDPNYALAYLWRGRALEKLKRGAEAQRDQEKAFKLDASLR